MLHFTTVHSLPFSVQKVLWVCSNCLPCNKINPLAFNYYVRCNVNLKLITHDISMIRLLIFKMTLLDRCKRLDSDWFEHARGLEITSLNIWRFVNNLNTTVILVESSAYRKSASIKGLDITSLNIQQVEYLGLIGQFGSLRVKPKIFF